MPNVNPVLPLWGKTAYGVRRASRQWGTVWGSNQQSKWDGRRPHRLEVVGVTVTPLPPGSRAYAQTTPNEP